MKKITNINTAYIESIRIYGPAYFTTHEYRHIYYKIIICRNWMVFSVRAEQVSSCVCAHRTKLSYLHARQRFFAIIFILNGIAMKRRLFIFYLFSHTHFSLFFFSFSFLNTIFIRVWIRSNGDTCTMARVQCERLNTDDRRAIRARPIRISFDIYYYIVVNWAILCVYTSFDIVALLMPYMPASPCDPFSECCLLFYYLFRTQFRTKNVNWDHYYPQKQFFSVIFPINFRHVVWRDTVSVGLCMVYDGYSH